MNAFDESGLQGKALRIPLDIVTDSPNERVCGILIKNSVNFFCVREASVCIPRAKKNLDTLIAAFSKLHSKHNKTQLVLVGPMTPCDLEFIEKLHLGKAIGIAG